MNPIEIFKKFPLVTALAAFVCGVAQADTAPGDFVIGHAAGIYVTPRGQKYFDSHLPAILQRNGADLSNGKMPSWGFESPKDFDLDNLSGAMRDYNPVFQQIRARLRDWLEGFELHNPRLAVQVKKAGYDLEGLRITVRIDPELTRTHAQDGAVIAVVEASIPRLRIQAEGVRGRDLNNSFLGTFGLNKPWLELQDKGELKPLLISAAVRIQIRRDGTINFQALSAKTDLDQHKFAFGYDPRLVLPVIQLQVGDNISTLNLDPIVDTLRLQQDELVRIGLVHLKEFIEQDLPGELNHMAFAGLKQGFETVNEIAAPGSDPKRHEAKLAWGLRPSGLGVADRHVYVDLASFVKDPAFPKNVNLTPTARPEHPSLKGMEDERYDFALVVSQDVINRILELSYKRGDLKSLDDGKGGKIILAAPPVFTSSAYGNGKFHVVIQKTTIGVEETIALKSPYQVALDIDVRLQMGTQPNSIDIVANYISKAQIPQHFVRTSLLDGSVTGSLRSEISDMNAGFVAKPMVIAQDIELPTTIFNIPVVMTHAEMDQNGYMDFYMEYGAINP